MKTFKVILLVIAIVTYIDSAAQTEIIASMEMAGIQFEIEPDYTNRTAEVFTNVIGDFEANVKTFDSEGRVVMIERLWYNIDANYSQIDLSGLKKGNYRIEIEVNNQLSVAQIVIP